MKSMTIRLDDQLADELGIVAATRQSPVSLVIRAAMEEYIENVKRDPDFQAVLRERITATQRLLVSEGGTR